MHAHDRFAGHVLGTAIPGHIPADYLSGSACMVRLIDRRTGDPLRIDGAVFRVFTRNPSAAVRELMAGRDRQVWEARIDRLGPAA